MAGAGFEPVTRIFNTHSYILRFTIYNEIRIRFCKLLNHPSYFFTGLAGVGKSEFLLALSRALTVSTEIDVTDIKHIPLVCAWKVSLRDGVGMNTLLRPNLEQINTTTDFYDENKVDFEKDSWKLPTLLKLSRKRTWRDGVCLLWVSISVGRGMEVAIQPMGVGVTLAPGQLLNPINDLVENFSSLMMAACIALGAQKILIHIGGHWIV